MLFPFSTAMKTPHLRRPTAGFTVIELVTVLVLLGILASIAGPAMGGYVGRNKTRSALDRISSDVSYARILAIREGQRMSVVFTGGGGYLLRVEDTAEVLKTVDLADDYPGVAVSAPAGSLTFDSRGLLRVGSGDLIVAMDGMADTMHVSAAGRVYRGY